MKLVLLMLLLAAATAAQQARDVSAGDIGYRIGQIDARIEALRGDVKRLDDRVGGVESKLTGVDSKISALEVKHASLDTKLNLVLTGLGGVFAVIVGPWILHLWTRRGARGIQPSAVQPGISREEVAAMVGKLTSQQSGDMNAVSRELDEIRERLPKKSASD